MSDTIYRQDAIDVVRHAWAKGLEPTQFLEDLPSAQPKPLKYSGTSICCYCKTTDCDGCLYEPMAERREE